MKLSLFFIALLFSANALLAQEPPVKLIIHFDFDKHDIRPLDALTLDNFFAENKAQSIKSIELYGHCDSVGNHAYNDALSHKRVEQTRQYLIGKGISESLIVKNEGFGKRRPLNENNSPEDRFENRRVELIIYRDRSDVVVEKNKPTVSLTEIIKDTATKSGKNIVLRNLQFQPGRHYLLIGTQPILEELFRVMTDNPTLMIEIQGHVCCTPDDGDGLDIDLGTSDLSRQRAKAVYEFLVSRGIDPSRLSYTGFGGSRKLYPQERDNFEQQENRRVELRIVKR